ncbi:cytochrome c oxidase subunit II [Paenibacillus sp. D51F]|uniref:cytochrome c oxidase subunit II n=1 Tax=unclassified Paenibacillus TaxID=185978 RepID=UPI0009712D41|nr:MULTISPECIES: cytochrome c oxidase subunit II [unclassified Paenibacillus]ASS68520.1 cytochrome c oxidase subunit II [Paenibacillus sp. RUD330]
MMKRWHLARRLLPLLAGMALFLSACGRADLSTLRPQGPVALEQFNLMKLTITIMVLVIVVVFALSFYVIVKFRRRPGDNKVPVQVEGNHKLEIIWTVIPIVLLLILGVPTVQSVFGLAKDYSKDDNAVQVIVTGHQYWWEFEYPQYGIKTAQELMIPTGKTISISAKSADVIHSFWIPSLAGKIDTNPGSNVNKMYFSSKHDGVYLGKCAELCGPSHALMDFKVKSVSNDSFDRWVAGMKEPGQLPADAAISDVFQKQCLTCHAVGDKGLQLYPNLTNIGDRETIGGILVNTDDPKYKNEGSTYDNLKRWISDPQAVKPGNSMPKVDLTKEQIDGIAKYLSEYKQK